MKTNYFQSRRGLGGHSDFVVWSEHWFTTTHIHYLILVLSSFNTIVTFKKQNIVLSRWGKIYKWSLKYVICVTLFLQVLILLLPFLKFSYWIKLVQFQTPSKLLTKIFVLYSNGPYNMRFMSHRSPKFWILATLSLNILSNVWMIRIQNKIKMRFLILCFHCLNNLEKISKLFKYLNDTISCITKQ